MSTTNRRVRHALILAHGDPPSLERLRRLRYEADLFIATDGAANELPGVLIPDVVLGDFDSLSPKTRKRMPGAEFVHAPDQDHSDLQKAIEFAQGKGFRRITIAGATGGRIDHTLASFSLLYTYAGRLNMRVVGDSLEAWAVRGAAKVAGNPGDTISLIAFEPAIVTIEGVHWPLGRARLVPGSLGMSNRMTEKMARIRVDEGTVIVVHLGQEAVGAPNETR